MRPRCSLYVRFVLWLDDCVTRLHNENTGRELKYRKNQRLKKWLLERQAQSPDSTVDLSGLDDY